MMIAVIGLPVLLVALILGLAWLVLRRPPFHVY